MTWDVSVSARSEARGSRSIQAGRCPNVLRERLRVESSGYRSTLPPCARQTPVCRAQLLPSLRFGLGCRSVGAQRETKKPRAAGWSGVRASGLLVSKLKWTNRLARLSLRSTAWLQMNGKLIRTRCGFVRLGNQIDPFAWVARLSALIRHRQRPTRREPRGLCSGCGGSRTRSAGSHVFASAASPLAERG